MAWMSLFGIVGLGLVVLAIWLIARVASPGVTQSESPETILKRRYAGGEMTREEYDRRLQDLRR